MLRKFNPLNIGILKIVSNFVLRISDFFCKAKAMARRKKAEKREIAPDPVYHNITLSKFINQVMRKGKKTLARKIVYAALALVKEKTKKEPLQIFEMALKRTSPSLAVRSKRIGGATYQVPVEVGAARQLTLATRWLIEAARSRKGKPMKEKLAQELIDAANNTGAAVRKKENIHRMAEANRAFAHFAW